MRQNLTRERLEGLMREIARSAPTGTSFRVYLLGGGTAVHSGWRESTIDADLHADDPDVLADVQRIKEQLGVNIEFARPEDFVPPLGGSTDRHVFIDTIGRVSFFHYDPYAQLLSKVVRGFDRDMQDARSLVAAGLVDPVRFRALVEAIPQSAYAKYPTLSREAVADAVGDFLTGAAESD